LRLAILCEFFLSFTSNSLSANMFLKIINWIGLPSNVL
jgi:hypothetical protein